VEQQKREMAAATRNRYKNGNKGEKLSIWKRIHDNFYDYYKETVLNDVHFLL